MTPAQSQARNGVRRKPPKPSPKERVLPHNLDAEASVLGGIILHNEALQHIETLETNHFYHWPHKVVFEAMRNLEAAGKPIDHVTLEAEIQRKGRLEAVGGEGAPLIGELCIRVPTVENVLHYARVVRDMALVRDVIVKAKTHAERGYGWEYEADEFLGELLADLQQIERNHREAEERIPIITIDDSLDELERLARTPIFETPYDELNRALGFGGMLAGQVYYLCGGTGFGKTSFVAGIVRETAVQHDRQAIIAFYEMFAAYYTARMSAGVLGVHANRILRGEVDRDAIKRALSTRIEMLDKPSLSVIKRLALRHVRNGRGAPLIVIDYVQLLAEIIMAQMTRPDARLAASQASAGLRELAKETGAAVIAVSAAGRSASRKLAGDVRKLPARELVDSSRESGAIEFDGAGVIVLSVSDEKDADGESIATISLAKARFGETVHIDARYDGRTGAWRSLSRVAIVPKVKTPPNDGSLRAAIVEVLEKHGILSKNRIHELTKKNKTAVISEVDAMIGEGLVIATNRGFSLVREEGSAPVPEAAQTTIPGAE